MMKVKLLVCCHKEDERGDDLVTTVAAGAALREGEILCDARDDDGENISSMNPVYNEMTVLYWAWKNPEKLGEFDHIGLMHYRRYFYCDPTNKNAVLRTSAPKELLREKALLSRENAEAALAQGDFIAPAPQKRRSVYKQYALTQDAGDLDLALEILKELSPEYAEAADEYMRGKDCYFFNMFVFPRDVFLRYAAFVFPILEKYVERRGETGRLYVSERLTGVFIHALIKSGYRPVFLPVLYREDEGRFERFSRQWRASRGIKEKALAAARLIARRRRESKWIK